VKRLTLALTVAAVVLTSGVAAAAMLSANSSPSSRGGRNPARLTSEKGANESDEARAGIHGGPKLRFHEAGRCNLVDISKLQGNWTHGDYMQAAAALGDASLIPTAAHSDCGKPMISVGHRHGPPDFVAQKLKARKIGGSKGQTGIPAR
jgi:hypothetical protein